MLSCYLPGGNGPSKHWQKKSPELWFTTHLKIDPRRCKPAQPVLADACKRGSSRRRVSRIHVNQSRSVQEKERTKKNRVYNPAWSLRATVEGVIIRLVASTFHSRPFGQKRRRARHATLLSAKISAILRIKKNKYSVILTVGPEQRVRLWSFRLLRAIER